MTPATVRRRRLLDSHLLVTFDALAMIGPHETRTPVLQLTGCFSMTGSTFGGLKCGRAVMMTPHAQGCLLIVKITCHPIFPYPRFNASEDLTMGELSPFILIRQDIDDHLFRHLVIRKFHGSAGGYLLCLGCNFGLFCLAHGPRAQNRSVDTMALAAVLIYKCLVGHACMTTRAVFIFLSLSVAANTALG